MEKKTIALLLCVMMVVSLIPSMTANAVSSNEEKQVVAPDIRI